MNFRKAQDLSRYRVDAKKEKSRLKPLLQRLS